MFYIMELRTVTNCAACNNATASCRWIAILLQGRRAKRQRGSTLTRRRHRPPRPQTETTIFLLIGAAADENFSKLLDFASPKATRSPRKITLPAAASDGGRGGGKRTDYMGADSDGPSVNHRGRLYATGVILDRVGRRAAFPSVDHSAREVMVQHLTSRQCRPNMLNRRGISPKTSRS